MLRQTCEKQNFGISYYRDLRLNNMTEPRYRHIFLLLYWPLFGLVFSYLERFYPVEEYTEVHCFFDDCIPFCEWFFLPYLFWFVYVGGMVFYCFFFDITDFRKIMSYIIITYSFTLFIYFIFPTCQNLRPEVFPRNNFLTQCISYFYFTDTNTNVCPSLHIIGTFATLFASFHTPKFQGKLWRAFFILAALLICASTVFLKQHSVVDVLTALPICVIGYFLCFRRIRKKINT